MATVATPPAYSRPLLTRDNISQSISQSVRDGRSVSPIPTGCTSCKGLIAPLPSHTPARHCGCPSLSASTSSRHRVPFPPCSVSLRSIAMLAAWSVPIVGPIATGCFFELGAPSSSPLSRVSLRYPGRTGEHAGGQSLSPSITLACLAIYPGPSRG